MASSRPKIDYERLQNLALIYLYYEYVEDGPLFVGPDQVARQLHTGKNIITVCLRELERTGLVLEGKKKVRAHGGVWAVAGRVEETEEPSNSFTLTTRGRQTIESMPEAQYDALLNEALSPEGRVASLSEAKEEKKTDEGWEPLALERDSSDFREMIESSEKALKEIEQNNGYAQSTPEERNGIVLSIRGALSAITDGSPSENTIYYSLLAPLKFIAKKFADASMGKLASIAVVAISRYFGWTA